MSLVKQGVKVVGRGLREVLPDLFEGATETGVRALDSVPKRDWFGLSYLKRSEPEKYVQYQKFANEGKLPVMAGLADYAVEKATKEHDKAKALGIKQKQVESVTPEVQTNFTVSKENLAPNIGEANVEAEKAEVLRIHEKVKAIKGERGEGGLSTASTIGQLPGQQKGFNLSAEEKALTIKRAYVEGEGLGTKVEKIKGPSGRIRTDVLAEIENMPYRELHHIFGKALGAKIIDNVWELIEANKATVEDLINLNHWAKYHGMGLGDFGTEAVNRVAHSDTHTHSRKFGLELSSDDIKAIPSFNNMDELTSYFRELIETKIKPMRGELDLQQGAYDILPDRMRLDVEQLKLAKEDASRELTQSYKEKYNKRMTDTPPEVKDAYKTHIWIQEKLGVIDEDLIEKAKELDKARYAQDEQMKQLKKEKQANISDEIRLAEGQQTALEEQSEWRTPNLENRETYKKDYATKRADPETTADRQMLEALTVVDDAKRQEYIDLLRKSKGRVKIGDLVYKDSKGKWKLRKITKALRNQAEGKTTKSKK